MHLRHQIDQFDVPDGTGLVVILTDEYTTLSFNFFKNYWRTSVLLVGPLIPLSWPSGGFSPGFQSRCGQYCLRLHVTRSLI